MTVQQALSFAIIGGAVALFASGRFRYDLVALGALLVGLAVAAWAWRRIGGQTGDVLGACCVLAECVLLTLLAAG